MEKKSKIATIATLALLSTGIGVQFINYNIGEISHYVRMLLHSNSCESTPEDPNCKRLRKYIRSDLQKFLDEHTN